MSWWDESGWKIKNRNIGMKEDIYRFFLLIAYDLKKWEFRHGPIWIDKRPNQNMQSAYIYWAVLKAVLYKASTFCQLCNELLYFSQISPIKKQLFPTKRC